MMTVLNQECNVIKDEENLKYELILEILKLTEVINIISHIGEEYRKNVIICLLMESLVKF